MSDPNDKMSLISSYKPYRKNSKYKQVEGMTDLMKSAKVELYVNSSDTKEDKEEFEDEKNIKIEENLIYEVNFQDYEETPDDFNENLAYDTFVLKDNLEEPFKPLSFILNVENDINSEFIKQWKDANEDSNNDALKCKFLIVIAMYDEKAEELNKTIKGILGDMLLFKEGNITPDQIGCVVIVDGIEPFYKTYRSDKHRQGHGKSKSCCNCCGFCNKSKRDMDNIDSNYFSRFFNEWKIIERFAYQNIVNDYIGYAYQNIANDYIGYLDDLKYIFYNFHGSKRLARKIIRSSQNIKEIIIKILQHKEHHDDFISFFENYSNDKKKRLKVFKNLFSENEIAMIDKNLYIQYISPAYNNGQNYLDLIIKILKLPNDMQGWIIENLLDRNTFNENKENIESNIVNMEKVMSALLKTGVFYDIQTLSYKKFNKKYKGNYKESYSTFHLLDEVMKNILFEIDKVLNITMGTINELKESCRSPKVRTLVEKTLKLSIDKEKIIEFFESPYLSQSLLKEKSDILEIYKELISLKINPEILINYIKFTSKHLHFQEPLFTKIESDKEKYQFKLIKKLYDQHFLIEKDEIAHCFSTKLEVENTNLYLNTIFCVKQLNKRKLNTHRWFLEGFCKIINPKYIMMLDVGTKPEINGLYSLFRCMENQSEIAGCCGEIIPEQKPGFFDLVIGSQTVEYKFSHIMDKALESAIGYVSVLPGAFSAYRMECITSEVLKKYFYSQRNQMINLFHANMYLAEDRILCLELVCQKNKANILKYIHESVATTDVPETMDKLIAQRRRWINGSWFSMIYTIRNWTKICRSNHGWCFKVSFFLLVLYYSVIALFNWVLVGAFYLAFSLSLKRNLDETNNNMDRLSKYSTIPIIVYFTTLLSIVVMSLSVKPRKVMNIFNIISIIFGLFTIATIILTLFFVLNNTELFYNYLWMKSLAFIFIGVIAFVFFFIISLYIADKTMWIAIKSVPSFIFMTGTFVNVFMIYSVCNLHDCSWGNRPDKMNEAEKNMANDYKNERTRWLIVWILCNGSFVYSLNYLNGMNGEYSHFYINIIACIAFGIIVIKFIGGVCYFIGECLRRCRKSRRRR
ncbi:hypothetical protein SteCoe_23981 [Stentor coeruleus]|uniref:chitin synthase n=1 Tax=Stentor coeruleus TaxID=5963 RepID=A0A1R2BIN8_9CILI|nr:hypothetical protein SteCoe_23981 [Stentor coeruleus]